MASDRAGVTLSPNTRYIVVRNGSGIRSLTGVLPVTNAPAVADFLYNFYIASQGDGGHTGDWVCGTSDYDGDGDFGTDHDIEAFFACLAGSCCADCCTCGSDFNGDGDFGTELDIEAFFRVLGGGSCAP